MQQQALANLKDLHMPEPIGIWPLAYGWYIVIIFSFMLIALLAFAYMKYRKKKLPQRLALKELKQIELSYQSTKDVAQAAYQLSTLLKRFCFAHYPRQKLARLYGSDWQAFLGNEAWAKTLTQLSYQKPQPDYDLMPLFSDVRNWIRKGVNV